MASDAGTLVVGIGVGLILIGVFALRMDWREFREAIAQVRWSWIVAGAIALFATIAVRGVRWLAVSGAGMSAFGAY